MSEPVSNLNPNQAIEDIQKILLDAGVSTQVIRSVTHAANNAAIQEACAVFLDKVGLEDTETRSKILEISQNADRAHLKLALL